MNRLHRATFLAGGALVALTATACSSSPSKPAAAGVTTGTSTVAAPSSTATASTTGSSAPSSSDSSSSAAPSSAVASTSAGSAAASCDNAKLNASLVPATASQKASVSVIAVKNTGPACELQYLPYVWIVPASSGSGPEQTRPLIPSGLGGGPDIIASGQTQYAAIDLNPDSAANAVDGYLYLAVTANPTPDTTGKDVQDLKLPSAAKVAKSKLGLYRPTVAEAISSAAQADTPEQ